LVMLGSLAGCYAPMLSANTPLPAEPPQPLHPANGYAAPTASVPPFTADHASLHGMQSDEYNCVR